MPRQRFASIAALIDADENGQLDDSTFDDELWSLLVERISTPQEATLFARPVQLYYASRFLQWEVGNGGFAQAAYNIPEWFDLAAAGYDELGLGSFAALIREATSLVPTEVASFDATQIGELFAQFAESGLASLDRRLGEIVWEADVRRIQYVRENRVAFRAVA